MDRKARYSVLFGPSMSLASAGLAAMQGWAGASRLGGRELARHVPAGWPSWQRLADSVATQDGGDLRIESVVVA
jgi:hypothetical protein